MFRRFVYLVPVALALFVSEVSAAPLDSSANQKIDQAINEHYLATDFDKAEAVLLGVLKACGTQCGADTKARAWMYIGLVRGSGRQNQSGALEAFQQALAEDTGVKLDQALATPETLATFEAAKSGGGAPAPIPVQPGGGGGVATMSCTPAVREVQTNRPIPVSCTLPAGGASLELAYRNGADGAYTNILFDRQGKRPSATIPCEATAQTGELHVYAVASSEAGDLLGQWGTPDAPVIINIVEMTTMAAPALPGQPAPARCSGGAPSSIEGNGSADCPPGFPGCAGEGSWGDSCTPAEPCKEGLYCSEGICEPSPSCDSDEDCESGTCSSGFCDMAPEAGGGYGPYPKNWVGAHFAIDVPIVGGNSLCRRDGGWDDGFRCYDADGTGPIQNAGLFWSAGQTATPVLGTMRALLSYDRFLTAHVSVGARAGFAFGAGKADFTPLHAEARLAYWLIGINDFGFNPYVFAGGGMAQVNGKVQVYVCDWNPDVATPGCLGDARKADAYKLLGLGFVEAGAGTLIGVAGDSGVLVNLSLMYMFPFAGMNLEPSLGYVVGF